jgi:hypothetical protein
MTTAVSDQPADINLAGDIFTPAVIEEMLGDWGADQNSPPSQARHWPQLVRLPTLSAASCLSISLTGMRQASQRRKRAGKHQWR